MTLQWHRHMHMYTGYTHTLHPRVHTYTCTNKQWSYTLTSHGVLQNGWQVIWFLDEVWKPTTYSYNNYFILGIVFEEPTSLWWTIIRIKTSRTIGAKICALVSGFGWLCHWYHPEVYWVSIPVKLHHKHLFKTTLCAYIGALWLVGLSYHISNFYPA